ncbi:MAG: Grx4 family monothiol glutaredoxin [Candidatus Lightella neohaematopini]|nr:Grx4 family monothiol glutaredoxin [Candidatus Lightella neohaematopini]MCV2531010.1 Grx4 family monothiol glutaredoxin [Candidatus Lightella neohaematopini]
MDSIIAKIKKQINNNPILLYMKGTPERPSCGFSMQVIKILFACGKRFAYIDVLTHNDIRRVLPTYSNWPTFPQLWLDKKLIGGCDIITDMYNNGKLEDLINKVFNKYNNV